MVEQDYTHQLNTADSLWRKAGALGQSGLCLGNAVCSLLGLTRKPLEPTPAQPPEEKEATPIKDIDAAISRLELCKNAWINVSTNERAKILNECKRLCLPVAKNAAAEAAQAHGTYGNGIGEELSTWFPVAGALVEFESAMASGGCPRLPSVSKSRNGQYVVSVFPTGSTALLFGGTTADIWIQPGKLPTQGEVYRNKKKKAEGGSIALVLGAGNQLNITVLDILHMLLVEDKVVLVKMHPLAGYLGQFVQQALAPFFSMGYVELVYGGILEGEHVCKHPSIQSIHLTGSSKTFDTIVWGPKGPEAGQNMLEEKCVTGELGCVTPYIIVPGDWTAAELTYQAKSVVSGLMQNSSHNCCALEILVTSKRWHLREEFLREIRKLLCTANCKAAWYTGSDSKRKAFENRFKGFAMEECGRVGEQGELPPWKFVTGLDPSQADVTTENWCGVFQEVCLDYNMESPINYLDKAVEFANQCWGTLSCSLFIKPTTRKLYPDVFTRAIEDLRFGSIVINGPSMLGFAVTSLSWGAFPGNDIKNIGSGNCMVHNTLLLDHPQKSVLDTSWNFRPHPFWFYTLTNAEYVIERSIRFLLNPGLFALLALLGQLCMASS